MNLFPADVLDRKAIFINLILDKFRNDRNNKKFRHQGLARNYG
jgi:hypothetical protein